VLLRELDEFIDHRRRNAIRKIELDRGAERRELRPLTSSNTLASPRCEKALDNAYPNLTVDSTSARPASGVWSADQVGGTGGFM
jgi:hypothetical protein